MLWLKEIKKTVFSVTFFVFIAALVIMPLTQNVMSFRDHAITLPKPGEDYGMQTKEIPANIMPAAFESLCAEYASNSYIAYPIGFYKNVKLNDAKQQKIAEILSDLAGVSVSEVTSKLPQNNGEAAFNENGGYTIGEDGSVIVNPNAADPDNKDPSAITLRTDITYDAFKENMEKVDDLIGGGSKYSQTYLLEFSRIPVTYEEALAQYNLAKTTDKFTGAYARLFCDYVGLILPVLPVFLAVAICLKDKRSNMNALIYVRKASSFKLIVTRYLAILAAVMLPVIILSYIANISIWGLHAGATLDYLAPLKYALGWLMPSAMISAAIGMFFTELTGTPIAIAIQGLWWFIDINMGTATQKGAYRLYQLAPRHNSLGHTQTFIDHFDTLVANRLLFAAIAFALVFATIIVYEQKRRGRLNVSQKTRKFVTGLKNRKSKSAA